MTRHPGSARHVGWRPLVALLAAWLVSCDSPAAPVAVATVEVSPFNAILYVGPAGGQTRLFTAIARRANGAAVNGAQIAWTSSDPDVASIDSDGLVTALAPGFTVIEAEAGGKEGSALLHVGLVPAASYRIEEDSAVLEVGGGGQGSHQLVGVLRDSSGAVIDDRPIFWGSTANSVATVNTAGLIRGVNVGTALIIGGREGRTDTVRVRVAPAGDRPPTADIAIADAQWTQGTQLADGSLPMIRNGRAAVVNVLLSASYAISAPSIIRFRVRSAGGAVLLEAARSVIVPTGAAPSYASPHAQFLVPHDLLQPGHTWEVVRDPDGLLPDAATVTDVFPRAGPTPIATIAVPTLRLRLVPVNLLAHGGVMPELNEGQVEDYIRTVRQVHPVGPIEVTIGPLHHTAASFGTTPTGGTAAFWSSLISELDVARRADPANIDAYWMGIVAPPDGYNFVNFGGFGYIPSSGASTGAATRTSAVIRLDWFIRESQTREVVAHELGHNLGRRHSPCGGPAGVDATYPFADGRIGPGGHNVQAWSEGSLTSAPAIDQLSADIMGYCSPFWMSRYTYHGILQFRGFAVTALRATPVAKRVIVVRGAVSDGGMTLEPSFVIDAVASDDDPSGDHIIEGLAEDGRVLFRQRTSLGVLDHAPGIRHFSVHVPVTDGIVEALSRIQVSGPQGTAERRRSRLVDARATGTVRVDRIGTGRRIACENQSTQTIVIQDDITGHMIALANAKTITLPASAPPRLRVTCSDGVRSRTATAP